MASSDADLNYVADLLRDRRRVLQPEDVGFARGRRRRTPGLRREEVAALCAMSTDYYGRLERHHGTRPSPNVLASIARGLRLTRADRDRLFAAAGYDVEKLTGITHVEPGAMHVLGRLADTPALALGAIGEVLHQTPQAKALFGDLTGYTGWERSGYYRWFANPEDERRRYPADEQAVIGAEIAADLRRSDQRGQPGCAATELVRMLLHRSGEFATFWRREPPGDDVAAARRCRVVHPGLGAIEVRREVLTDAEANQRLVLYLAAPGSESHTKLKLLTVIGHHRFDS